MQNTEDTPLFQLHKNSELIVLDEKRHCPLDHCARSHMAYMEMTHLKEDVVR